MKEASVVTVYSAVQTSSPNTVNGRLMKENLTKVLVTVCEEHHPFALNLT
jgi:hypothetical protein